MALTLEQFKEHQANAVTLQRLALALLVVHQALRRGRRRPQPATPCGSPLPIARAAW